MQEAEEAYDKHGNNHRKYKMSFQAILTADEKQLFLAVKRLKGIARKKEVLIILLKEEIKRLLDPEATKQREQ